MLLASMCPSWHLVGSNISSDKRLGFPGLPPQWEVEQRMRERNFDVLCTYAEVGALLSCQRHWLSSWHHARSRGVPNAGEGCFLCMHCMRLQALPSSKLVN